MPIARRCWEWSEPRLRTGSIGVRAVIVTLLAVGGFFYVLMGPLVFDAAYWLLGKIVRVQADRRVRIGASLVLAVVYLASMEYIGLNEKPSTQPGATSTTAIAAAASPTASVAAPATPTVVATSAPTATPAPTPTPVPTAVPTQTPSPTPVPTPTPRPTAVPTRTSLPTPPTLLSISGSGIKSSKTFSWSGDSVDLTYTFNCSNFGSQGNFQIYFYGASILGPTVPDILANDLAAKGGDTTTEYLSGSTGPFHLEVNSECKWTVAVTGMP